MSFDQMSFSSTNSQSTSVFEYKGDYQALSRMKSPDKEAGKLERGDSAREASALIFGRGTVVVEPKGEHLAGIGSVAATLETLETGLQSRSAWALDYVLARIFSRGVFTGSFKVKEAALGEVGSSLLDRLPLDVVEFERKNDLAPYLIKALNLAEKVFEGYEKLEIELHQDHEASEEWIILRVQIWSDKGCLRTARREFNLEWVKSIPATHRYMIRLSLDIL